jgi:hypothetical protein
VIIDVTSTHFLQESAQPLFGCYATSARDDQALQQRLCYQEFLGTTQVVFRLRSDQGTLDEEVQGPALDLACAGCDHWSVTYSRTTGCSVKAAPFSSVLDKRALPQCLESFEKDGSPPARGQGGCELRKADWFALDRQDLQNLLLQR